MSIDGVGEDMTEDAVNAYSKILNIFKKKNKKGVTMPYNKDNHYYNMNHLRRGKAIIFNHETFNKSTLERRQGTETDCANLEYTLSLLGFDVEVYKDLTYEELDQVLENASKEDYSDCDCLLIAVLSHGEHNMIYAKNKFYPTNFLCEKFIPDVCPTLAEKPKLYIIQACQGNKFDRGIEVEVDSGVQLYLELLHKDFLIAYSTIPGFYSWRNLQAGSWFIQALCDELNKHWREYDLMTILTFVNRRVAFDFESNVPRNLEMHKQKQIPCVTLMLTRLVKFQPKDHQNNGIGAYI